MQGPVARQSLYRRATLTSGSAVTSALSYDGNHRHLKVIHVTKVRTLHKYGLGAETGGGDGFFPRSMRALSSAM